MRSLLQQYSGRNAILLTLINNQTIHQYDHHGRGCGRGDRGRIARGGRRGSSRRRPWSAQSTATTAVTTRGA